MPSNHMKRLDKVLQDCHNHELDWTLLPTSLREKCRLFAKGLKQTETSILLGLLVLIAFCMGHATVNVHPFWSEPVIVWIISVITTGRCKSAFHEFLSDTLDLVADKVREQAYQPKPMVLPHCTWDKFGDLLANSGGRSLGLFDEVMSFFSTMNMYSSVKMQVSDTREYQDFLQMFTGKAKTRETVTGNANFNMQRTTFTLFGFTQPYTALPVIEDISNNAKGFTSRMLWFFPRPVFCKMRDNILDQEECNNVEHFKEQLVDFLADLYIHGETTYIIEENSKMKTVTVNRTQFFLSKEALSAFEMIHDNWELEVCKRNPHDAVVGGIYSRGKSHILRLSVPIQLLLSAMEQFSNDDSTLKKTSESSSQESLNNCSQVITTEADNDMENQFSQELEFHSQNTAASTSQQDAMESLTNTRPLGKDISKEAIAIAHCLVDTSLKQLCTLTEKADLISAMDSYDDSNPQQGPPPPSGINKVYKSILSCPGCVVSFSLLNTRGVFRRHCVEDITGRQLMHHIADKMPHVGVGTIERFVIPGNKSHVFFFVKQEVPEDQHLALDFARKLAPLGMSLPAYQALFMQENEESARHMEDYNNRKENPASPTKKRKRLPAENDPSTSND